MPKEVIRAASFPYGEEDGARSVVEVRWDRDAGHVQLVTRCVSVIDGGVHIPEWVQDLLTKNGLAHTQMLRNEGDDVVHVAQDGWFIDLDRYGLNNLIRNLRRARDQAFGRDE
jgi:hypothetical protein